MTPEKVLFRTNDYIERQIEIIPKSEKQEKSKRENLDFALSIKSAIEKQIPRKPILDTTFPSGVKWWRCPVCAQKNIETNDRFCYRCGQALWWGDTQ